jgi:hypothetical protein
MTEEGAATKMAPNYGVGQDTIRGRYEHAGPTLPMMPMKKRKTAHMYPDCRDALRVRAMTPLFCEKVCREGQIWDVRLGWTRLTVKGGTVARPARVAEMASASIPPWTRSMKV